MGSVNDLGTNIVVYRFDQGQETVASASDIVSWVGAASSWVGFLVAAYNYLDGMFDSKRDPVAAKLDTIIQTMGLDKESEIVNSLTPRATVIDTAGRAIQTYRETVSEMNRQGVRDGYKSITDALANLLSGLWFRLIPTVYASAGVVPQWVNGRWAVGRSYSRSEFFQEYAQEFKELDWATAYPASLSKTDNRWDGLLCLPLVIDGLPVWQAALTQLEPFFRLSGQYTSEIEAMSNQMRDDFGEKWKQSVVWTRDMPYAADIAVLPDSDVSSDVVGGSLPAVGFYYWWCGVLDPVLGVERIYPNWWMCDGWGSNQGPTPEFMTDQQRAQFKARRHFERVALDDENGFNTFTGIASSIGALRTPPSISPSLRAHPRLLQLTRPSFDPTKQPRETVIDPGGTEWDGVVQRSSVIVRAPISVQPNPAPKVGTQTAESDVVFGYEITVTPSGGEKQHVAEWVWPLRQKAGERSLYHDPLHPSTYDPEILRVPYSLKREFPGVKAATWTTVTDGTHHDENDKAVRSVSFIMTVTVCDQMYSDRYPEIPLDPYQFDPKKAKEEYPIWSAQHAAIWITIEADANANEGRSFELLIDVKETARVDEYGRLDTEPKKTYTVRMPMAVDIAVVAVPSGYFEWIRPHLEAARKTVQVKGKPGPRPGPDPLAQLVGLRAALKRDPSLVQAHVKELRRITKRKSLTPEQALAQLDTAVGRLTEASGRMLTEAQLDLAAKGDMSAINGAQL